MRGICFSRVSVGDFLRNRRIRDVKKVSYIASVVKIKDLAVNPFQFLAKCCAKASGMF